MEEREGRPVLPMGSMESQIEMQGDLIKFLCMHGVKEENNALSLAKNFMHQKPSKKQT